MSIKMKGVHSCINFFFIKYIHKGASKVLQYFGKVELKLAAVDPFIKVRKMLGSCDTLQVILARFTSMDWSTASESKNLGLPDLT